MEGEPMWRWVLVGVVGVFVLVVVGVFVTYIPKLRESADEAGCVDNLRKIALFAAHHVNPQLGAAPGPLLNEIPPATVVLPDVPPADRLSWFVGVLPGLDQRRQNTEVLLTAIDPLQPWTAGRNQQVGKTRLLAAICPGNPPPEAPDAPAPTQYVGIAGLGPDAALLPVPLVPAAVPPRAGCFRYDAPTPFEAVTDGLSQTLLLGERSGDLGPWLRGGPATVRGLDDSPGAPPLIGAGGQFGGNHLTGANWALADGSVRFFSASG
jgi:hypothetical protein